MFLRQKSLYKYIFISILICIILTIYTQQVKAQLFDSDQASSKTKWRQINEARFQLIFPQEFEKAAPLLASQINSMLDNASKDLGINPRKISIIVQENHIEQNGFAQLAPRKVELFSTPGPASDNTKWLPNLVQHELRHVAQFDKLTGKIKGPFFEQLALALYGLHLPAWYFEGDAVSIETQFSNGGRGRSSAWMVPLKANMVAGKNYSFDKNILGSFKDITPSYYLTGYLMNSYLSNNFGYPVKEKIMDNMRKNLLRPFNFNVALKKETDMNSQALYKQSMKAYKGTWEMHIKPEQEDIISPKNDRYFSHYYLPQTNGSGEIFTLVESPDQVSHLAKIEQNSSKKLFKLGYQLRPYFHLNDNHIVWDEIRRDARFGKQTYNIIRIYDIKTKKTKDLSKNSRFYSPVIDSNSENVYVVHVDQTNVSSLVKINLETLDVQEVVQMPADFQLLQPALHPKNNKIVAIVLSQKGNNLIEIDLESKSWEPLFAWSNQEFERPIYAGESVIFKAQKDQKDNIFRLDLGNGSVSQVTFSSLGNYSPSSYDGNTLYYNSYKFNGQKVGKLRLDSVKFHPVKIDENNPAIMDRQLNAIYSLENQPQNQDYQIKKYNPLSHLFNFHSLSISANNFESFDNYRPGIFWIANDLLNTSQVKLGYEYDLEREKSSYSAEVTYQKYYPKFTVSYENRGLIGQAKVGNNGTQTINFDYREHVYMLDMQIPMVKYRGNVIYSYGLNFGTSYQKRYDLSMDNLRNFRYEIAFPLNYQVYLNRNWRRSQMDLIPKWGQNINIIYRHVPFTSGMTGNIWVLKSNFYFPGFFRNHGFQARLSYQNGYGQFANSNELPMVGGWAHFKSEKVDNTLLLNYRFPIAYPDWSIGPLGYIKRFHGYLFTDYQNLEDSGFSPASYGVGLSMDFNLMRYKLPDFGLGGKLSYINHPSARGKVVPSFSFSYSY
ncbi:TolB family protein [Sphingobacterium sp. CZ-2]|uniref:TolB family protein n=1 Tax=Sphingobacterium sp. CZ-2 TaxID=2557994 RepID=UPI00106F3DC4|nr:hypothetical protein [Sphingobacterium sp. CZ-2]QBR12010.1 hypothetical protein E3D81_07480 [Sphingobacterium sp. CZ-2]